MMPVSIDESLVPVRRDRGLIVVLHHRVDDQVQIEMMIAQQELPYPILERGEVGELALVDLREEILGLAALIGGCKAGDAAARLGLKARVGVARR